MLEVAGERARRYLGGVDDRPVIEEASVEELRRTLGGKLSEEG